MLSERATLSASDLDIPWRYVDAGQRGRYDPDTNPTGVVTQFTSAENYLIQTELSEFVSTNVEIPEQALGYSYSTAGGQQLPAALAAHLNGYWKPWKTLSEDDIRITGAATALHEILGFSLADPGQGIMTSRPYYGRFEIDFGLKAGLKIVAADTPLETCLEPDVVSIFEETLLKSKAEGVEVRALLITNPHNPLGRCYPKETLITLIKFCQKHQIHLISDEIYALSGFDSTENGVIPFTSVLSLEPHIDEELLHVIYGMAKDYAVPGLRVGALITRSKPLLKALKSVIRFHNPSGPSVSIATAMFEDREWMCSFIEMSRVRVGEAYRNVTERLTRLGVTYLSKVNAGLFIFVDLSPWLSEDVGQGKEAKEQGLAQRALGKGLFLQPGEEHALEAGWFRLVYTVERRVLSEGLNRLEEVLRA
ncbi:PLP-dependent transferase [Bimuria novae-zelandiae CBS 107.79]|uniref:PLP-dependent transferase n=1 Tax=Bimuria novae-zelandiae CBS 107.79 TaxID=1447943 RepID=A0A6A5VRT5_9PLEO|nr:PLP-dependent transferase [Bimuria novae-zelandiae CBS 107.79]